MINPADYPFEEADNISWFNEKMQEEAACRSYQALMAMQEDEQLHRLWNALDD